MEKKIIKVLEALASIAVITLTVSVVAQILAREFFHVAATWSVEVCRASFTAIVFLGAPIAVSENSHLSVLMVKEVAAKNKKSLLFFDIIGDLFIYLVLITLTYGCYNRTLAEWKSPIPTVEWMTYGEIYGVMLIGSLCMLYMQIRHTIKYVRRFRGKEVT